MEKAESMGSMEKKPDEVTEVRETAAGTDSADNPSYALDKWRFPGVIGLVIFNIVGGLGWPWFGSISAETSADFHISITQVNWLGNAATLMFLPGSLITPYLCKRYGIRTCCVIGSILFIISGWVRFAGAARSLSPQGAYTLLLLGQLFAGLAQPVFQVIGPRFSEAWFNFDGRTTATMIISIANPVGAALGQLLPSLLGTTRNSILVLAIICTAVCPVTLLVRSKPPMPPTFSGALPSPPPSSTIRSLLNTVRPGDRRLPLRTRADFFIVTAAFGTFVAAANAFSILTAQLFGPFGYNATDSGLFGAVLILSGLFSAIVSAPLFDRVLTKHITLSLKLLVPILGAGWLSLIWIVRANNTGGIFAMMAVIGVTSLTLLPISLEIACELARDAETSAAILWFTANMLSVIFVLVQDALTAGPDASPPFNMRRASIFIAAFACAAAVIVVLFFRGLPDTRRALDAAKQREEAEKIKLRGAELKDVP